jgi:5-formyltetrahydrofolate cyclo-ligase
VPDDIEARKRALRAELRERRRIRTSTERSAASDAVTERLIDLTRSMGATAVAGYLSTPDEPSTRGWLDWLMEQGVRVLLPISRVDGLLDWAEYDGSEEMRDAMGMPAPSGELLSPMAINGVDLIVVPAATVDRSGMRMGWGRGYFDKTLGSMEACPPVYAVVFDDELVEQVPSERHDVPVTGAVTPGGIVTFSPPSASS